MYGGIDIALDYCRLDRAGEDATSTDLGQRRALVDVTFGANDANLDREIAVCGP
jgi:hypothetical protein